MNDEKASRFSERFPDYIPPDNLAPLLREGKILSCKCAENGGSRTALVTVAFPRTVQKKLLYRVEQGLLDAYGEALGVRRFLIMVKYPSDCFSEDYIPELVAECNRVGAVAKGLFRRGKLSVQP